MGYNLYMKCSLIFPNNLFENNPVINKNRKIYIFQDPSFFQNSKYTAGFNKKKLLLHLMSTETYHNNLLAKNLTSDMVEKVYLNIANSCAKLICKDFTDVGLFFDDPSKHPIIGRKVNNIIDYNFRDKKFI